MEGVKHIRGEERGKWWLCQKGKICWRRYISFKDFLVNSIQNLGNSMAVSGNVRMCATYTNCV